MANSPQARKRARQADARREQNAAQRSLVRTRMKQVVKAITTGDKEAAQAAFKTAVPIIDRMARKGIISPNKAARSKSRYNTRIKAMG